MIYLYTSKIKSEDWIIYNDSYFNLNTANQKLTDNDKEIISEIDSAKVTDDNHIETKYGLGTIRNLSSGCKTYLNVIKNPQKVVSAEECGGNVLEYLFKIDNIRLYMSHPERFDIDDNTQICFNDTDIVIGRKGYENWWSGEYERRLENDL
jgi:hypothetical protein